MKSETLKIGLPINSRLSEDLKPFTDALELEGKNGRMRANGIARAEFRMLRVQDIASFLRRGLLDLGIVGLDVMTEYCGGSDGYNNSANIRKVSVNSAFSIKAGEPTRMMFLAKQDEESALKNWQEWSDEDYPRVRVVTSYPNIASSSLEGLKKYFSPDPNAILGTRENIVIQEVAGRVEEIVANGDLEDDEVFACLGMDIVKSGRTARECGLVPFGKPILESTPELFSPEESRLPLPQIQDSIATLREKFTEAGLPISAGSNVWEYKEWKLS